METVLYADVLFFINFSMDFISIWASSYLCSKERKALRMSASASIGAVYGVLAVAVGLEGVFAYISAGAVSILMSLCAFGMPAGFSDILRQSAVIWGSGALLGGVMTSFLNLFGNGASSTADAPLAGSSFPLTATLSAAVLYATVRIITRTKARKSVTVTLSVGKRKAVFTALCDSGNLLRDPITGTPVMTVCQSVLSPLLGNAETEALSQCKTEELTASSLKIRFIPRKTADGAGISAAFMPDKTEISETVKSFSKAENREKSRDKIIKEKNKKTAVRCLVAPLSVPEGYFGGHNASFPTDAL